MLRIFFISSILFFSTLCDASEVTSTTRQQYIAQWKDEAIYQMAVHKIPASITLAQGILESGDGNSRLAREGNNHFGIKCHADWSGKTIVEDDETKGECFRKYDNARESYEDHSAFLQRKRYESLFALETDNYKGWAKGLKQCGYATNPKYPDLLIGIIEQFDLAKFDSEGMAYIKKKEVPERIGGTEVKPVVSNTESGNSKPGKRKNQKGSGDERSEITISNKREIARSANNIKYTVVKNGETIKSIAEELEMSEWQILRYNDLSENANLKEGQLIYTQPKRNKAKEASYSVKKGDTLWSISQQYGIKMKRLKAYNALLNENQIKAGQVLKLRK